MEKDGTCELGQCSSCSRIEDEIAKFTTGPGYNLCEECVKNCELIIAELKAEYENLEGKSVETRFA